MYINQTDLKVDIVGLRNDVDELKSSDFSMLFGTVTPLRFKVQISGPI